MQPRPIRNHALCRWTLGDIGMGFRGTLVSLGDRTRAILNECRLSATSGMAWSPSQGSSAQKERQRHSGRLPSQHYALNLQGLVAFIAKLCHKETLIPITHYKEMCLKNVEPETHLQKQPETGTKWEANNLSSMFKTLIFGTRSKRKKIRLKYLGTHNEGGWAGMKFQLLLLKDFVETHRDTVETILIFVLLKWSLLSPVRDKYILWGGNDFLSRTQGTMDANLKGRDKGGMVPFVNDMTEQQITHF